MSRVTQAFSERRIHESEKVFVFHGNHDFLFHEYDTIKQFCLRRVAVYSMIMVFIKMNWVVSSPF